MILLFRGGNCTSVLHDWTWDAKGMTMDANMVCNFSQDDINFFSVAAFLFYVLLYELLENPLTCKSLAPMPQST